MISPLDVVLDDGTIAQPDLLVARRGDLTDTELPATYTEVVTARAGEPADLLLPFPVTVRPAALVTG